MNSVLGTNYIYIKNPEAVTSLQRQEVHPNTYLEQLLRQKCNGTENKQELHPLEGSSMKSLDFRWTWGNSLSSFTALTPVEFIWSTFHPLVSFIKLSIKKKTTTSLSAPSSCYCCLGSAPRKNSADSSSPEQTSSRVAWGGRLLLLKVTLKITRAQDNCKMLSPPLKL